MTKKRFHCQDCGHEFGYKDVIKTSFSELFIERPCALPPWYFYNRCPKCYSKNTIKLNNK